MLSELVQLVHKKWPNCYLTLHYKSAWSVRDLNGEILEYGNCFDKLLELVQEDNKTVKRPNPSSTGKESSSFFSYEEKQNILDWLELAQDPYNSSEIRV